MFANRRSSGTVRIAGACLFACLASRAGAQNLYTMPEGTTTHWSSPENPTGAHGMGGQRNGAAKGRAFERIAAHGSIDLLNTSGAGVIERIKLTLKNRTPEMLRSLRIEMYWDGATRPAVSAPLGDFFGTAFGQMPTFENAFFSDPEGRSFTATIPMPFRKGARITIFNDSATDEPEIFFDVNYQTWATVPSNVLYFHAWWHRDTPPVGEDFTILPPITGRGRFLGMVVGVRANPAYSLPQAGATPKVFWWGEGEMKMYLDGDTRFPSLVGTGAEDYFGSAWGMSRFINTNVGCTVGDPATLRYSCYRFHIPDPIYFQRELRINIQQIGGGPLDEVRQMAAAGAPLTAISVDADANDSFYALREIANPPALNDPAFPIRLDKLFPQRRLVRHNVLLPGRPYRRPAAHRAR